MFRVGHSNTARVTPAPDLTLGPGRPEHAAVTQSQTPARAPTARSFLLGVIVGGLALGTMGFSCAPVAQRLTAPIACPAGTRDTAVVSHVTRNDRGTIVTEFELRCIDADGGSVEPPGVAVFGAMVLYGVGLASLFGLVHLVRRRASLAATALALVTLGGCEFGTVTRDEFEHAYPYGAGPMFSRGRAEAAARALEVELGGPQRVTGVTVSPETVSFSVLRRGTADDVDVHTYRDEGFSDPFPVQTSAEDDVSEDAFPLDARVLARVTELVRDAPRRAGMPDGHVESLSLTKSGEALEFHLDLESDHRRGSARYDARGTLIDARID